MEPFVPGDRVNLIPEAIDSTWKIFCVKPTSVFVVMERIGKQYLLKRLRTDFYVTVGPEAFKRHVRS